MEQNAKAIFDYINIISRRKYYILIVFVAMNIASAIVAYSLPRTFRSTATMLMEALVPKEIIQSTIAEYADEQIRSITQKVMTTDNVLAIIESSHLYGGSDDDTAKYDLADQFKRNTDIALVKSDLIGTNVSGQTDIAFTISFSYEDPNKAREVVDRLTSLFIEQNDRSRTQRAIKTADFLTEESKKLNKEIQVIDDRISDFKKQYKDSLPEQHQGNLSALDRKESELRDIEHQIRLTKEKITFLTVELARIQQLQPPGHVDDKTPLTKAEMLKVLQAQYLRLSVRYNPSHPTVLSLKRQMEALGSQFQEISPEPDDIRKQLAEAKHDLKSLQAKAYADDHPDVVRSKNQIDALLRQLKQAEAQSSRTEAPARFTDPASLGLEAQLKASQGELESLAQIKDALKTEIEALREHVARTPEVEKDYLELARERDHTLNKYNQLKEKLLDAKLVQTLEEEQHGQTLTVIEQPTVPTRPEKAIRRKVIIGGFFLGIAAALGCALLLEFLDPRIRGYRALSETTGLMPLVVIPYIESPSETEKRLMKQSQRRKATIRIGTACLLLVAISLFIVSFQIA